MSLFMSLRKETAALHSKLYVLPIQCDFAIAAQPSGGTINFIFEIFQDISCIIAHDDWKEYDIIQIDFSQKLEIQIIDVV